MNLIFVRRCSYALSALFSFLEYCFRHFLKDKGMHQCDLFSQEQLNIENKRVSLICNHDS